MNALAAFTATTVNEQSTSILCICLRPYEPILIYTKTVPLSGFVIINFCVGIIDAN